MNENEHSEGEKENVEDDGSIKINERIKILKQ